MSTGSGQKKAADSSAATAQQLGNQYNAQQQQMYGLLFGGPNPAAGVASTGSRAPASAGGSPTGPNSGGVLNQFLNPSSLNVTTPTGVYGQQFTNAKQMLSNLYGKNAQNIKTNAAQAGFGSNTPAGFTQTEENQNARALADATGQAFSDATTSQYQDALKNFWKSIGAAQTAMGQGEQGALQGTSTAAQTYANLYGNSGRNSPFSNFATVLGGLGSLGGGVGAAAKGLGV